MVSGSGSVRLRSVPKCLCFRSRGSVAGLDGGCVRDTPNPKREEQIDTIGWVFAAIAVIITVSAALIAYCGNREMVANAPASHVTGSPG